MRRYISAYFTDEENLLSATRILKEKNISILDVLTPFPVHGLDQILGLKALFSFACPFCFIIVLLIVRKYPITESFQLDIRKKLEKQKQKN